MKKLSFHIFLVGILTCVLGCGASRRTVETDTKVEHTIIERIVPRDTTIIVAGNTSSIEASIEALIASQKELVAKNGNSTTRLIYNPQTKTIKADCECDSNAIKLRLYDKFINEFTKIETNKSEVIIPKISFWKKIQYGAAGLVVGLVLIGLTIILTKIIR